MNLVWRWATLVDFGQYEGNIFTNFPPNRPLQRHRANSVDCIPSRLTLTRLMMKSCLMLKSGLMLKIIPYVDTYLAI